LNTDFPAVISTNYQGVMEAMRYIQSLGHRRIGFISGRPDLQSSIRRLDGYREGLTQAGIAFDPALVVAGDFTKATAVDCAHHLLAIATPPTAIMAANDDTAFGVYEAAQTRNLRIPEDLSVVGFDNIVESAFVDPPLTTVDQSIERMGALAAEIVLKLIQGQTLESQLNKVPTRLVIRQSCRQIVSVS
jgi:LacI family transcriptional regulator